MMESERRFQLQPRLRIDVHLSPEEQSTLEKKIAPYRARAEAARELLADETIRPWATDVVRRNENAATIIGNKTRYDAAVRQQLIHPLEAYRVMQPQRQWPNETLAEGTPNSPWLPHQDGELAIFRGDVRFHRDMLECIHDICAVQWPNDQKREDITYAVARTALPQQVYNGPHDSTPRGFRNPRNVAAGVVELTSITLAMFDRSYPIPTDVQLGTVSKDQLQHIVQIVRATIAQTLIEEMTHPDYDEDKIRALYLQLGRSLRRRARLIGPDGMEIMKAAIEDHHDVVVTALTSRLSTEMIMDLGCPGIYCMSEKRLAELLWRAAFIRLNPGEGRGMNREEYEHALLAKRSQQVNFLLEHIQDRMKDGDIREDSILMQIESLDYDEHVIRRLFNAADPVGQEILLQLLSGTSRFREVFRELREKAGIGVDYCASFELIVDNTNV